MDRQKLLIVDDIPENLEVMYHGLKGEYEVLGATSGPEALMTARSQRPDLILLDVMMPEMDGYQVCAALKSDPATRDIPVIFITAKTDPGSEARGLSAGIVDFIHKPFKTEVVRARVRLHLELERHRNHLEELVHARTRELAEARDAAESANRAKSDFLAIMSHELRTPLNSILGLSEMLQEEIMGPLTERQRKALVAVEESGQHLLEIITDILDLSSIEADRMTLDLNEVTVDEVCRAGLRMVREKADSKQISLTFTSRQAPEAIRTDPRRLKQILINLLANAVKFTPEGGEVSLAVIGDPDQRQIRFLVTDTGIGIAAGDLEKLFQPFSQLDNTLARRYEGTGLGLALVARLTALLAGSVSVESDPGIGSRFTVVLPWETSP